MTMNPFKLTLGSLISPQAGGSQRAYLARFVRAGAVLGGDRQPAGFEITAQALQEALALGMFNNRAVFIDHAAFYEVPSLEKLVGVTTDSSWNEADQAVEGAIQLYSTPSAHRAAGLLDDILANPATAPDVGLSMVFYPVWKDDPIPGLQQIESLRQIETNRRIENIRRIESIRHIESVDLVFQPAADGRVLQALSACQVASSPIPVLSNSDSQTLKGNPPMTQENVPVSDIHPTPPAAPAPASLASVQIVQTLLASGLPAAAQERLASRSFPDLAALQQAIEAERRYLAAIVEPGVVQLGTHAPRAFGRISGMLDSLDRITLATEALIQGRRPDGIQPLSGIRELYHLLSGDYEMTGVFQPERIGFANVTSSSMAGMVANALNKVVVNEFAQYPQWWLPIVTQMDFATLQQAKWITLGGVGELPTVAEGAAYTELTWDDNTETATFYKKGGYLGITLEAIDKDDTSRISAAPRALAQAAWLTLSKSISSIFTSASGTGPNLADGNPLFYARSAGTNVGSTALSLTEWNAVRTAMRKFTELNSGERVGGLVTPRYLLVPPDLEQTALRVLASEYDYTYALSNGVAAPVNDNAQGDTYMSRVASARQRVIVVDLWTDANNWAAVCDPRMWPTIGVGFRYGRTPEIFSVASPTAGLMFSNDTLPVKVRFFYATGPMDWRGMYKENVA